MFDGYSVLIKLSLQNQVSAGLMAMSGQFSRLQAQATALQAKLNSIRLMALTGLGLTAAGAAGFYMMSKALKPAEQYAHQLNIMHMAGMKNVEITQAIGDAWENTSKTITTTATQNLKSLLDLRNVLGDFTEAQKALPVLTRLQAGLMSSRETTTLASSKDFAFNTAKALDIIGAVKNKQEFETEAMLMGRAMIATQGRVNDSMFQQTFAYARQARYAMDNEFKYEILPSLMLEYARGSSSTSGGGGSRGVGPMLAAAYRITNQGYVNKKSLPELKNLGLVDANSALKTTTSGTTVGPLKNASLAGANPFLWTQQVLLPAIEKKYGGNATKEQIQQEINLLMRGNQLAAALFTEFSVKGYAFYRDQRLIKQAMNPEQAYQRALINDPTLARTALAAQWENVQIALTTPIVTILIPALQTLATWLNNLARVLQEYPTLAKTLSIAFLALSGSLLFGGVVMLLSAAFSALDITMTLMLAPLLALGAPIIGVVAALALLGYGAYQLWQTLKSINWQALGQSMVSDFQSLWQVMKSSPIGSLIQLFAQLWAIMKSGISAIGGAISSMGSTLSNIGKSIGGKIYNLTHPGSSATGANITNFAPHGPSSATGKPVAFNNATPQTIHVASTINLDGRQIARIVTEHQVKDANRVPNYSQGFDPSMSPTPMILKGNVA